MSNTFVVVAPRDLSTFASWPVPFDGVIGLAIREDDPENITVAIPDPATGIVHIYDVSGVELHAIPTGAIGITDIQYVSHKYYLSCPTAIYVFSDSWAQMITYQQCLWSIEGASDGTTPNTLPLPTYPPGFVFSTPYSDVWNIPIYITGFLAFADGTILYQLSPIRASSSLNPLDVIIPVSGDPYILPNAAGYVAGQWGATGYYTGGDIPCGITWGDGAYYYSITSTPYYGDPGITSPTITYLSTHVVYLDSFLTHGTGTVWYTSIDEGTLLPTWVEAPIALVSSAVATDASIAFIGVECNAATSDYSSLYSRPFNTAISSLTAPFASFSPDTSYNSIKGVALNEHGEVYYASGNAGKATDLFAPNTFDIQYVSYALTQSRYYNVTQHIFGTDYTHPALTQIASLPLGYPYDTGIPYADLVSESKSALPYMGSWAHITWCQTTQQVFGIFFAHVSPRCGNASAMNIVSTTIDQTGKLHKAWIEVETAPNWVNYNNRNADDTLHSSTVSVHINDGTIPVSNVCISCDHRDVLTINYEEPAYNSRVRTSTSYDGGNSWTLTPIA